MDNANNSALPVDRSIGQIIAETNNLSPDQVEKIVTYQRENGVKFGEAAVALGFVEKGDVLWALAQQFHYPYAASAGESISEELVVANEPFSDPAEFFRDVRSKLLNGLNSTPTRSAIAVCSAGVGDGKSYFAANLAVAFSQLGSRTLLVDADMRTPRQHEIFGLDSNGVGLSGILSGRAESNVVRPIPALQSLFLMPVGVIPPNPLELIQGRNFDILINELLNKFEYVVVDTPAATYGADARVIAAKCRASVAVARVGRTKAAEFVALEKSLKLGGNNYLGSVLNQFKE
ncbi:polysaccharide biosynthesis tyrosine autokinase [Aquabacterium soli]|jgi:protein-tyrosine kinase|uniref:Polysaccharide biosynthesis tyrosine autokinase n=1 Tax=Aquabacterium soli TaxID=2493092 RepID=A0A426UZ86_9BURK|nr:polysaccharide biosynthesis tyrosine autokinase [Aquabacterium soli]RRR99920.1 polysaccharide biosynthesis tyrosine autokinase [Aquabacterium soli]